MEGDISLVQKSRVPLFTLAAALRQPDVYKGRWVLLRGALSEIRQEAGKPAAMVRETSLRATAREVQVGNVSRWDRSSTGSSQGEVSTTRYGDARGSSKYASSGRSEFSTVKQKFDNERVETGRLALGRLAQADPFLEPEKDFLSRPLRGDERGPRPAAGRAALDRGVFPTERPARAVTASGIISPAIWADASRRRRSGPPGDPR